MRTLSNMPLADLRAGDVITRIIQSAPGTQDPATLDFSAYPGGGIPYAYSEAPEDPPENGVSHFLVHFLPGPALDQFKTERGGREILFVASSWRCTVQRTSSTGFDLVGPYTGEVLVPGTDASLNVSFSLSDLGFLGPYLPSDPAPVTPLDIAEAINGCLTQHGWPPVVFYGKPPAEPIN